MKFMSKGKPMTVRHFVTELTGGTGVASLRLHSELVRHGIDSNLHHRFGSSSASHVIVDSRHRSRLWRLWQGYIISRRWRRQNPERGIFVHSRWIYPSRLRDFGPIPDVVNLHLVFRWLHLPRFLSSIPEGLPVVWSLHDLHPATGGCIHPHECQHFTNHCHDCPNLKIPRNHDRSWHEFNLKDRLYNGLNLHIVGNSEWTTAQARRSALMRHAKSFQTISPGLNTEAFTCVEKSCAREALALGSTPKFVVGFSCADFSDPNKGAAVLLESLRELGRQTETTLLAFGSGKLPDGDGKFEVIELGTMHSPRLQSIFYSACDVFAVPSRIESFGLTALEAMACGTPVVAFRTGGLAELVIHEETGLLADLAAGAPGLLEALSWMIHHPSERQNMGNAARRRVGQEFTASLMAQRYAELYQSLTAGTHLGNGRS
jgi:glycosyltransferase involved in cell wall biosynthesis